MLQSAGRRSSPLPLRSLGLPLALLAAYLATRLFNLGLLPMVSDEGTYLTWGVRALRAQGVEDLLASLEDGKQPLLAWLMPPFLALFDDRLIAGRLVSVLAGLANLLLLVALGARLFGRRSGWIAAALYVVAPIAVVHDRMALYDSLVTSTALLVLLASLRWSERPGLGTTGALGLALGLALLTKLSAVFFVALVPVVAALWRVASLRRWWLLAQAYFLAAAVYSVLYLSPIVDNIQEGNFQRYSLTLAEVAALPWPLWTSNARFVAETAAVYLGWPLAALAAAGCAVAPWRRGRAGVVGALWVVVPLIAFVLTAKIIYSRYVVFCLVAALLPAAALLEALGGRAAALARRRPGGRLLAAAAWAALAAAVAVPGLLFAARLLTDPVAAPWMDNRRYITDRFQYVESNYAGYGLADVVRYVRQQAQRGRVVVLTRTATGMPRDGVSAYLLGEPRVHVGIVPETERVLDALARERSRAYQLASRGADVYYVLTDAPNGEQERRFRALNPDMQLVLEVPKPGNHSRFQLYRTRWTEPTGDTWLDQPVRFGDDIVLAGFNLPAAPVRAGGTVRVVLYWEAAQRPARDYTVFNHVVATAGDREAKWGQHDGPPGGGRAPTSRWRGGDLVADEHVVRLRPETPPGEYDIITGLYLFETQQRLPVYAPGRPADHRLALGRVTVVQ